MSPAEQTGKLGFGLMRLPRKGVATDVEQVKKMVDLFLEAGFTYFDTAFVYLGSEEAARKALVERHPRDSYTLATKMNAGIVGASEKSVKKQFQTSLDRTGAGFFDYYLLHALMEKNVGKYERFKIWDFAAQRKAAGEIRHLGFSFHDGPELLDKLLTEHPEVDFVQLQINYADWENPNVKSRANYEVAVKHGKPVVVMEPVKGGQLAKPPAEVQKLFEECTPGLSPASWAIRFAASLSGVHTVLSGMSNLQQMQDNLSFMKNFQPLNAQEQQVIQKAQQIMGNSSAIPCTACRYCTSGCPAGIEIPSIFAAANLQLANGQREQALEAYQAAAPEGKRASSCVNCGQCKAACPQHIDVPAELKHCAELLET